MLVCLCCTKINNRPVLSCAGSGLGSGCFCRNSGHLLLPSAAQRRQKPALLSQLSPGTGADELIVAELRAVGGQRFHPRRAGEMLQALTECCSNERINNSKFHLFSGGKQSA